MGKVGIYSFSYLDSKGQLRQHFVLASSHKEAFRFLKRDLNRMEAEEPDKKVRAKMRMIRANIDKM